MIYMKIATHGDPFMKCKAESNIPSPISLAIHQIIFKVSVHNTRLKIPKDPSMCPPQLALLLASCWESLPEKRPSSQAVKSAIEDIISEYTKE